MDLGDFFGNSFIQIESTGHTIYPFKVYNSVTFSMLTELCSRYHNIDEMFFYHICFYYFFFSSPLFVWKLYILLLIFQWLLLKFYQEYLENKANQYYSCLNKSSMLKPASMTTSLTSLVLCSVPYFSVLCNSTNQTPLAPCLHPRHY